MTYSEIKARLEIGIPVESRNRKDYLLLCGGEVVRFSRCEERCERYSSCDTICWAEDYLREDED